MGRPTLAAQLAKAAAEGDMEKVKELASRLEKNESKKPKKTKTKQKSRSRVEVYEEDLYQPNDPYHDMEQIAEEAPSPTIQKVGPHDSYITSARNPEHQHTYIDENGDERVKAKIVPFKVIKNRKNKWEDDLQQDAADIEFDKLVHKNGTNRKQYRAPTNKVKVRCIRCKETKLVWPGEVLHRNWSCDECLASNKRR